MPALKDLAIVGATSTGKTQLAARIADLVPPAGLVSVDAFAVYRGMDVGTAKPTRPADTASRHPWALVDLVDASEEYSVAEFQSAARRAIAQLHDAGRPALLVGGTGLYHRAVVDELELPERYPDVAQRLFDEAGEPGGALALHSRLRTLDPVAADRLEPSNVRRVVRALEVTEGSGQRFSEFGPGLEVYPPTSTLMVGLALDRDELDSRLAERLRAQMDEGLLEEVGALAAAPGGLSRTARQAIGYRELLGHIAGSLSLEEALAETLRRLKSFARRQESWFRRDPRIVWFEAGADGLAGDVVEWWETRCR